MDGLWDCQPFSFFILNAASRFNCIENMNAEHPKSLFFLIAFFFGINQKSGWRVFYLLNGMCLSQPSSLYQRCFLFPLLKGPGFPTVFLENFPMYERFLKAKCFPTVKVPRSRLPKK